MRGSILLHCFESDKPVTVENLLQISGLSVEEIADICDWLIEIGVPLVRMPSQHLRLARSIIPLDIDRIQRAVSEFDAVMASRLEIFDAIDSTNQHLMRLPRSRLRHKQVCLAEYMTAGKGRQRKKWHGGAYENVMISIAWNFESEIGRLTGLSLAVAVMVVRCLRQFCDAPFKLKWPNDVLIDGRKLSGILIELRETMAIVGIGINCHMTETEKSMIDQPVASLNEFLEQPIDRNQLVLTLLKELASGLERFSSAGLEPFREDWMRLHAHQGRWVRSLGTPSQEGVALGIDHSGSLLVRLKSGELAPVRAGELEILPA